MSLAVIHSRALHALDAAEVTVEVHLANGLPSFTLVGLADTEVKEARERVRAAIHNSGLEFPHNKRITVSLAPADLPKESAASICRSRWASSPRAVRSIFNRPSRSSSPASSRWAASCGRSAARWRWRSRCAAATPRRPRALVLPKPSAAQAALVDGLTIHAATHLLDVVAALRPGDDEARIPMPRAVAPLASARPLAPDLREVKGQAAAKRALEIAAAGGHSLLMVGAPGSGKSMLAQRFAGLLPPMTEAQALESAALLSLTGGFAPERWGERVMRAPHHSASSVALVGGGSPPRPGEISLAHQGVLFLDEFPEFPRAALEALREPLETGRIVISRAARQAEFPAAFQLIAAMNPCPCGHLGSALRACRCTPDVVARYQGRISGPLLDRLDLQIEVPAVDPAALGAAPDGEPSAAVAERVAAARQRAVARQGSANAALSGDALDLHCALDSAGATLLQAAAARLGWSARGFHRVLRVARTVADLDASSAITAAHLGEAIQYRRVLTVQ